MIRLPVILLAAALPAVIHGQTNTPKKDLLRFTNGDQLHGTFEGITAGPRLVWKRDDIGQPMEVVPSQVRQVVLNGARPEKSLMSLAHVALVNGDRIPGVLKSLDEQAVVVDTAFAGDIRIPKEQVGMIAPSPLGGRLVYHGPFTSDEWTMTTLANPDGIKGESKDGEEGKPLEKTDSQEPGRWGFSGSAWYWQSPKLGTALIRKEGMPDRAILRFNVAWKARMSLTFAFHADFKRPPAKDNEPLPNPMANQFAPNDPSYFARLFGNSYIVNMNGNSVVLYRTGFDETGKPLLEAIRATSYNARFAEADNATVELRCNRLSGEISLFINDEFVNQWSEGGEKANDGTYAGKGSGFGFIAQAPGAAIRVSEIFLAEWNGMPDSARSLQVDDQDIVLLANGTDRFSGKVTGFKDGAVLLDGKYGGFRLPLDELAEIRFAKNHLAKRAEASGNDLIIQFHPLGRISGKVLSGTSDSIKLATPSTGDLNVNLESAVILDFNPSSSFLDDWDAQF
jgi:hypothetical protein